MLPTRLEATPDDMREAVAVLDALRTSGELSDGEVSTLLDLRDPTQNAAESGEMTPEARGAYLQFFLFVTLELTPDHPGPIPPPFPQ
ncbi:MAG: hypothetical protein KDA24_24545 [Deltaproteobacteria bacterium]|nr:hypothetical protein [Deltaproteobacteria bacterium]